MNPQRKRPQRALATSRSKSRSRYLQLASLEASGDKAAREGRNIDALRAYDEIVGLKGATASVWNKIGDLLSLVGEFAQAIGAFERALELDATNAATHHNLARALFALGDVDRSLGHLRRATILTDELYPWQGIANLVPNSPTSTNAKILAARSDWATRLDAINSKTLRKNGRIPTVSLVKEKPFRVAYLSAHFAGRNYMKPVWGVINRHSREKFCINLLSDKKFDARFPGYHPHASDTVTDVGDLSDDELAELVGEREIDILVDLSAYSHQRRLSFFLKKKQLLSRSHGLTCLQHLAFQHSTISLETNTLCYPTRSNIMWKACCVYPAATLHSKWTIPYLMSSRRRVSQRVALPLEA